MLRRAFRGPLAAAAAASASLVSAASPSVVNGSAHCSAKKPEAVEPGWTSPPPTVGAAEYDAVVREAMRRMADDALSESDTPETGGSTRKKMPPKKPSPADPSWSYTNVGEAAAEVVVREAMQRMAEEAELEREAQCEAEHPLSDVADAAGARESRLQRHTTKDQGLNRLRRKSTSSDDTHR